MKFASLVVRTLIVLSLFLTSVPGSSEEPLEVAKDRLPNLLAAPPAPEKLPKILTDIQKEFGTAIPQDTPGAQMWPAIQKASQGVVAKFGKEYLAERVKLTNPEERLPCDLLFLIVLVNDEGANEDAEKILSGWKGETQDSIVVKVAENKIGSHLGAQEKPKILPAFAARLEKIAADGSPENAKIARSLVDELKK